MDILTTCTILIIEKSGTLKTLLIKDYKEEDLYKKCGFKKADDFNKQTEWKVKINKNKYYITVFGKTEGRANNENKYDFPPPIDTKLFFGNCAIVAKSKPKKNASNFIYEDLTIPLWDQIYEKLFGGFEDLANTAKEDEEEEDELLNIPKEKKTSDGYLKDGFVVSSDSEIMEDSDSSCKEEDTDYDDVEGEEDENEDLEGDESEEGECEEEESGSELCEEAYD